MVCRQQAERNAVPAAMGWGAGVFTTAHVGRKEFVEPSVLPQFLVEDFR
jgi:hypothetical protein